MLCNVDYNCKNSQRAEILYVQAKTFVKNSQVIKFLQLNVLLIPMPMRMIIQI